MSPALHGALPFPTSKTLIPAPFWRPGASVLMESGSVWLYFPGMSLFGISVRVR